MKFKKGDKVRYLGQTGYLTHGKEYYVSCVFNEHQMWVDDRWELVYSDGFELVESNDVQAGR